MTEQVDVERMRANLRGWNSTNPDRAHGYREAIREDLPALLDEVLELRAERESLSLWKEILCCSGSCRLDRE